MPVNPFEERGEEGEQESEGARWASMRDGESEPGIQIPGSSGRNGFVDNSNSLLLLQGFFFFSKDSEEGRGETRGREEEEEGEGEKNKKKKRAGLKRQFSRHFFFFFFGFFFFLPFENPPALFFLVDSSTRFLPAELQWQKPLPMSTRSSPSCSKVSFFLNFFFPVLFSLEFFVQKLRKKGKKRKKRRKKIFFKKSSEARPNAITVRYWRIFISLERRRGREEEEEQKKKNKKGCKLGDHLAESPIFSKFSKIPRNSLSNKNHLIISGKP